MTVRDGGDPSLMRELLSQSKCARKVSAQVGAHLVCDQSVYFPIDAVISVSLARPETSFQIGFASKGDAIGLQAIFTPEFPRLNACVLRGGNLICVSHDLLRRLMSEDPKLKERLSHQAMRAMGRYLDGAACAVSHSIERRVAQWICDYRMILGGHSLPVTHQQIASALGVRRSGVTVALHVLEGEHLLRSKRARIEVLDIEGFERLGVTPSRPGQQPNASSNGAKPDDAVHTDPQLEPV